MSADTLQVSQDTGNAALPKVSAASKRAGDEWLLLRVRQLQRQNDIQPRS